jgi:hypothetical protein
MVGEQDGDLLAFTFEGRARLKDSVGEMFRGVRDWGAIGLDGQSSSLNGCL